MAGNYVDWSVRAEYEMLNESTNREDVPKSFVLLYSVCSEGIQDAWDQAMRVFPMKIIIGGRVYGRMQMRVAIEC
jgi:hypothetical protein